MKLKFLVIILNNIQGEIYIEIQSIPSKIPDEKLENKVIEIFGAMSNAITISLPLLRQSSTDCHRLGKNLKITIVWLVDRKYGFVNRKYGYVILSKKFATSKID